MTITSGTPYVEKHTKEDPTSHEKVSEYCICVDITNDSTDPVKVSVSFKGGGRATPDSIPIWYNLCGPVEDTIPPQKVIVKGASSMSSPGRKTVCCCPVDIDFIQELTGVGGRVIVFVDDLTNGGGTQSSADKLPIPIEQKSIKIRIGKEESIRGFLGMDLAGKSFNFGCALDMPEGWNIEFKEPQIVKGLMDIHGTLKTSKKVRAGDTAALYLLALAENGIKEEVHYHFQAYSKKSSHRK